MSLNTNIILSAFLPSSSLPLRNQLRYRLNIKTLKPKKNVLASLGLGFVFIFCSFFSKGFLLFVYSFLYGFRIFHIEHFSWWIWSLCFIGEDFSYYWYHRACHSIRFCGPRTWYTIHQRPITSFASFRQSWFGNINGSFFSGFGCRWSALHPK